MQISVINISYLWKDRPLTVVNIMPPIATIISIKYNEFLKSLISLPSFSTNDLKGSEKSVNMIIVQINIIETGT
jgi:hypothetical protein